MKRARKEPEHAFASGAEIKVFAWVEGGIATGESVTASGSPYVMTAIPEQPPTVLTVIGFGDCAANFDLIERLVLDHQSTGRNIIRYRDDTSGRHENKLVRMTRDRSEVLVSYEGFNSVLEGGGHPHPTTRSLYFGAGGGAAFNSQQLLSFQRRPSSQ